MAQTTEEERREMRLQGVYMSEKCDKCGVPLKEYHYSKMGPGKNEKWCGICAKGKDMVAANLKEETRMAKAAKEKKASGGTKKLFGFIVQGTAIHDLAMFLLDEKKHKLADAMKSMAKHKADKMGRIHQLVRYGKKKKFGTVTIDDDTIQLKLAKGVTADTEVEDAEPEEKVEAKKSSKKEKEPEKPAKKKKKEPEPEEEEEAPKKKSKKKKKEPEPEEEESEEEPDVDDSAADDAPEDDPEPEEEEELEASDDKALKSTAKLVRMTLKNKKKEWTKNKLIEVITKDHGVDQKRVEAALASEMKNGGVTLEDGVLQLT